MKEKVALQVALKIEPGTRIDVISKPTDSFTIEKVSSFDKVTQYTSELYKADLSLEEKVSKTSKVFFLS